MSTKTFRVQQKAVLVLEMGACFNRSCVVHVRYDHSGEGGQRVGEVKVKQDYNDAGVSNIDRREFLEDGARSINRNGEDFHFTGHGLCGNVRGIFLLNVQDPELGDQCIGIGYSLDAIKLGMRSRDFTVGLSFYGQDIRLSPDDVESLLSTTDSDAVGNVSEGRDLTLSNDCYSVTATLDYHVNNQHNVATVFIKRK